MKKLAFIAVILSTLAFSGTANAGGMKYCDYKPYSRHCQDTVNDFRDLMSQPETNFAAVLSGKMSFKKVMRKIAKMTNTKNHWYNKGVLIKAAIYCHRNKKAGVCVKPRPTDPVTVPEPSTLGLLGLGLLAVGIARRRAKLKA